MPLKILIVEDSKADTELLVQALGRNGYELSYERVETAEATRAALARQKWDLVISDYVLPGFSGLGALRIVQESDPDIPFIIVSGKIGEEVAVEALQAGAQDYLLKDKLGRLSTAVARAIEDAGARQRKRQAEQSLKDSEERYRRLVETSPEMMAIFCDGRISYINPAGVKLFGAESPVELIGRPVTELVPETFREGFLDRLRKISQENFTPSFEQKMTGLKGEPLCVEIVGRPISYHGQRGIQIIGRKETSQISFRDAAGENPDRLGRGLTAEFSTLFTAILGFAGLVRSRLKPAHPALEDLEHVIAGAERGLNLTRDLRAAASRPKVRANSQPAAEKGEFCRPTLAPALLKSAKNSVLIVEDEHVLRELTELILVKHGFTVFAAKNSEEALRIAERHGDEIGILFTDVVVTKLSGPELAKKLQKSHPEMRVLFTSGYPESVISEYGVQSHFEFLPKPYTLQNLVQRISDLLNQRVPNQSR